MNQIYHEFISAKTMKEEMERCESCLEKPCMSACPAQCSPADFIRAAKGQEDWDYLRAAAMILEKNPMGGTCGKVCTEKYCMQACSKNKINSPIHIPAIQAAILEKARETGKEIKFRKPKFNGMSVAVVGAGPAGLSAAATLVQAGFKADVFEKDEEAGGMCRLISRDRLSEEVLSSDIQWIESLGVRIFKKRHVQSADELKGYDGIVNATGRGKDKSLNIIGKQWITGALDFLPETGVISGKVAVIGGGGIALDCVRHALSSGAKQVDLFALETLSEMPLAFEDQEYLFNKHLNVHLRYSVDRIEKMYTGKLRLWAMPVELDGEAFTVDKISPAGTVPVAYGEYDQIVSAVGMCPVPVGKTLNMVDAGEYELGASSVVESVASGKKAAMALIEQLGTDDREGFRSYIKEPMDLSCEILGFQAENPFVLSASPVTDGYERVRTAYGAGWGGAVLKTAFDGISIRTPSEYMYRADRLSFANCDSVSARPLDELCADIKKLRVEFPDKLTMASTGTELTGDCEEDRGRWLRVTKKLEEAGAMGIEYSLSCPGTDGIDSLAVNQDVEKTIEIARWILEAADPKIPKLFKLTAFVPSITPFVEALKKLQNQFPDSKFGITIGDTLPSLVFQKRGKSAWENGVIMGMGGRRIFSVNAFAIANCVGQGIPVNASGGISSYMDAANYLAMGTQFVQLCSLVMRYGYGIIDDLKNGLASLMQFRGIGSIQQLVGIAGPDIVLPFEEITEEKKIPAVKVELCSGCGNCTSCHAQAVHLDDDKYPVFDPERCIGCSFCSQICFTGALKMIVRNK